MSHEPPRHDGSPPVDEGYWSSLLSDDIPAAHSVSAAHEPDQITGLHGEATDWQELVRIQNADETLDLLVIGYNRGGLLVEWRSLRGFVPASQLVEFPVQASEQARRSAMTEYIGQVLPLRVIELNPERNRLILSERAAQAQPGGREAILNRVQAGMIVRGVVTNLTDFGAFLDLGGLEGLIHISELSWGRVSHPSAILERGQEVEALVLEVDRGAGRIALSAKRLRPDPWRTVEERYMVGSIVDAVITNVVDFGAFASLEEGLEGLIHISELAEGHFLHPRNVVTEGQPVRARVLSIDGRARRMGLSLRSAE